MSQIPDAVWVNVNPSLRPFNEPLLSILSKNLTIAEWQYCQTPDEPASLEIALVLLQDFFKKCHHPIHLLGHGTGGLVSLLYSYRYPERVKSLTLLSVGAYPAMDWQAHYYSLFNLLPCSREVILTQMVHNLFGHQSPSITEKYRKILDEDLYLSLSPHNLYRRLHLLPKKVIVPLLVCGGEFDMVMNPSSWLEWKHWLKEGDDLWQCPHGRYFFHHSYSQQVGDQIKNFWQTLPSISSHCIYTSSI